MLGILPASVPTPSNEIMRPVPLDYRYEIPSYTVPIEAPKPKQTDTGLYTREYIRQLVCNPKYSWDCDIMLAIAQSENGYEIWGGFKADAINTANDNGSIDTGILQINSIHGYTTEWLQVPENNIEAGHKIYLTQGYRAWSDYNNNRYLRYIE